MAIDLTPHPLGSCDGTDTITTLSFILDASVDSGDVVGSLYSAAHILVLAFLVTCIATVTHSDRTAATVGGVATLGIGYLLNYFPTHTIITPIPSGALVILGAEPLAQDQCTSPVRSRPPLLALSVPVEALASAAHREAVLTVAARRTP